MPARKTPIGIKEVAEVAGVSTATVSRVLNGKLSVNPQLAAKVKEAVLTTGYTLNSTGRALRRQVSDTWAIIVPDIQNPFFTGVVASLEDTAFQNGYSVMLLNSNGQLELEQLHVNTVVTQRMAGVVIAVSSEKHSDISPITDAGIPIVLIDRFLRRYMGDAVFVDNKQAGRLAADHLLERGYTRIGCITGPADVSSTEARLAGLRQRLEESGLKLDKAFIKRCDLKTASGQKALVQLMDSHHHPEAIYLANGQISSGGYRAAQQLGLSIPHDVALLGTDDEYWTQMVSPALTVISQPVKRIGKLAGECLAAQSTEEFKTGQTIMLHPTLVVRAST